MAGQNRINELPRITSRDLSFSLEDFPELEGEAPTMQLKVGQPSERGGVAVDLLMLLSQQEIERVEGWYMA